MKSAADLSVLVRREMAGPVVSRDISRVPSQGRVVVRESLLESFGGELEGAPAVR